MLTEMQKLALLLNAAPTKQASELQKLAALLEKKSSSSFIDECGEGFKHRRSLAATIKKQAGFMQQGMRQLGAAVNNPASISRGAGKLYNAAGGGLTGAGRVATHYAPMAGMVAAPMALGAAGMGLMGGQPEPQTRTAELAKAAWSITEEGHKLDADHYNLDSETAHRKIKARGEYAEKRPNMSGAAGAAHILSLLAPMLGLPRVFPVSKASPIHNMTDQLASRHMDYAAKKHEKGENAYNPFGGWLTESRHETKDKAETAAKKPDEKKTEKKSSVGPQMRALQEKIAVLPLAAAAVPAAAGAAKGLLAGTVGRYALSKAAPMALNAGMNAMTAGPGAGNKLKAGLAGAATGLMPGSGIGSQLAGMAAQPMANKAFGVR